MWLSAEGQKVSPWKLGDQFSCQSLTASWPVVSPALTRRSRSESWFNRSGRQTLTAGRVNDHWPQSVVRLDWIRQLDRQWSIFQVTASDQWSVLSDYWMSSPVVSPWPLDGQSCWSVLGSGYRPRPWGCQRWPVVNSGDSCFVCEFRISQVWVDNS